MKSFAVDLYVWQPELRDWIWIPSAGSDVRWPAFPSISQSDLLSSEAGIVFRIDDVLWLGNERDSFPLEMWVRVLADSVQGRSSPEQLMTLAVGQNLTFEIRRGCEEDGVSISRFSTREPGHDYLERTAVATGCYYRNFQVPAALWGNAVYRALAGLRDSFLRSPPPAPGPERTELVQSIKSLPALEG